MTLLVVDVAQLAEPLVVVQVVVGSNPIIHPTVSPVSRSPAGRAYSGRRPDGAACLFCSGERRSDAVE